MRLLIEVELSERTRVFDVQNEVNRSLDQKYILVSDVFAPGDKDSFSEPATGIFGRWRVVRP